MAIISLQSAASALNALNTAMDITANNLANINTPGFKASRANFQDLMYIEQAQPGVKNLNGDQRPTGLYVGLGTKISGTQYNFADGSPQQGGQLDLRISGNGFFKVAVPESIGQGGFAYTRAGQFALNSNGDIVMANDVGSKLDPPINVGDNVIKIDISPDGEVFVTKPGTAEPQSVGTLTLTNFINPSGLKSAGKNLFVETGASGPPIEGNPGQDAFGTITQNQFEGSNVDPTTELVNLIQIQRAFEMNSNSIRAADQTLQTVAQIHR
jgi:flagellar basal-body rod protein FlgG